MKVFLRRPIIFLGDFSRTVLGRPRDFSRTVFGRPRDFSRKVFGRLLGPRFRFFSGFSRGGFRPPGCFLLGQARRGRAGSRGLPWGRLAGLGLVVAGLFRPLWGWRGPGGWLLGRTCAKCQRRARATEVERFATGYLPSPLHFGPSHIYVPRG